MQRSDRAREPPPKAPRQHPLSEPVRTESAAPRREAPGRDAVTRQYSRLAPVYERKWSFYIAATTEQTVRRIGLQPAERLLDVGCGTGALLRRLSLLQPSAALCGIDAVPAMLSIARRELPAAVALGVATAQALPFAAGRFDVVASCNMFHYLRDPVGALREMTRVLRPGGRLVITDWCDDYWTCRLCDRFLRWFDPAHFRTYGAAECGRLLDLAGQPRAEIERYKINWLWGLMTATSVKGAAPGGASAPESH